MLLPLWWCGLLLATHAEDPSPWQARTIPPSEPTAADAATATPTADPLWYRAWLQVPSTLVVPMDDPKDLWRESMTLALEDIPGPFRVTLNGVTIIEGDEVPPGLPRRFKVPKDILQEKVFNALALRLESAAAARGLTRAPVFGGYLDEVPLHREWEVRTGEAAASELQAVAAAPARATYTPADWRPAHTVLQAPTEPVRGRQVPPGEALAKLRAADGFVVESLLHEPAVAQPTHLSYDERGRLWVAQYRQYPYPAGLKMISRDAYYRGKYDRVPPAPPHHDRGADIISVHEDRDGDGVYEHAKEVLTGLNMANAALWGHGGIWVMHTPYLLFYPDADGDDVPDADPETRLAGFGLEDTHSTANGLVWGPDGWLYGAQGSTVISHVVNPADPPETAPLYLEGCAIWRYHPSTRKFEIFADGSGNTFGPHFDGGGRLFSGHNGGDTRGWHHLQEGIYLKQGVERDKFGPPLNPFAFGSMPPMATTHPVPRFSHNVLVMEGTALPAAWRGQLLGADPLHQNLVASQRVPAGSTFVTTDTGVPLRAEDMTFRPVYLAAAPDGSLTIADFREEYIAHGQNYQGQIDPSSGRVYRLRGKTEPLERDVNVAAKTNDELVGLLDHANPWHRQTAVRLLAERACRGDTIPTAALRAVLDPAAAATGDDPHHPALEALWVLHQTNALDEALARQTLRHPGPMVRAWTIRLLGDARTLPSTFLQDVIALAATEPDAEVRAQLLSTARRLPAAQALPLVLAVMQRDADADDPFIPLLAWFTLESHCATHAADVLALWETHPDVWARQLVRRHLTPRFIRRFAAEGSRQGLLTCAKLLRLAPTAEDQAALLAGFEEAFQGRAMPALPDELAQALAGLGKGSLLLRVRQGEPAALTEALAVVADPQADPAARRLYARVFGEAPQAEAEPVLLALALGNEPADLRQIAFASLSAYDTPAIGRDVATHFSALPPEIRDAALNLLASRPAWTLSLLEVITAGDLARETIPPELLTRLRRHRDAAVTDALARLYPAKAAPVKADLRPRLEQVRAVLGAEPGDPYAGEPLYMERCAACHTLFHKGGRIGPNLTGYQREDLGSLLIGIIDPNAEIREGYANQIVTTKDGRTLGGFLADQDANVIVLRGFDGNDLTIQRNDVAEMQGAGVSLMPEGLLDGLTDQQVRDLFAYLRISQPISR